LFPCLCRIFLGLFVCLAIIFTALYFLGGWQVSMRLLGEDTVKLEYGDPFQEPGAEAVLSGYFVKEIPLAVSADQPDFDDLGQYTLVYHANFLGYHGEICRTVEVVDETPPEIILETVPDHYTRPIDEYQEEGYSATDAYDGDLTDQMERWEEDGVVHYTVTDSSGNTAHAARKIFYDDREAPALTLIGEGPLIAELGEPIPKSSCRAIDDCDGDITGKVHITERNGTLTYTVRDSYGNIATATRAVKYRDTAPPVITLDGGAEIRLKAGLPYEEPGYTAQDKGDGDLTRQVTVEGYVNSHCAGEYILTYSVSDRSGNIGSVKRTVHVEPQPQPDAAVPDGKVVYLTFDDGPGPYTQKLLDVLERYNVKVTFFVTGFNSNYQYLIGEAYAAGHSIGVHTYSHEYGQIYASEDAFFEDFEAVQEIIRTQTGQRTTLMRFPGGSSNTVSSFTPGIMSRLAQDVTDMGYQYFDWNVLSGDAGETDSTDTVFQNVIEGIQQHDASVVLQHDIKGFSVDAVESILKWGIQNGYTFLPLAPTSPTAHHGINN